MGQKFSLRIIIKNFIINEEGQAITEYILLLSLIVVAFSGFKKIFFNSLDLGIRKLGGTLEKDLRTGRGAPLGSWKE